MLTFIFFQFVSYHIIYYIITQENPIVFYTSIYDACDRHAYNKLLAFPLLFITILLWEPLALFMAYKIYKEEYA